MEHTKTPAAETEGPGSRVREEDETFFDPTDPTAGAPMREGLPPGYRMRHDEHYVDELIASGRTPRLQLVPVRQIVGGSPGSDGSLEGLIDSIQEFGVLQPLLVRRRHGRFELVAGAKRLRAAVSAGLDEVPCLLLEVDETEARRLAEAANRHGAGRGAAGARSASATEVFPVVEAALDTILSTLALLDQPAASLRDQVAVGLIRTEARRANRLLRGQRLLAADPPVVRRRLELDSVLRSVLSESEEERGLLAVHLDAAVDSCAARADERLVSLAFGGAVDSLLALLRPTRNATMSVRLATSELTSEATLVVSEDSVRMPTSSWSRWFDLGWEERPGGYAAGVALLAARRASELDGGRLEVSPTDAGGCRIAVTLPLEL